MKKLIIIFSLLVLIFIGESFAYTRIMVHDWGNFPIMFQRRFSVIINRTERIINSEMFKAMVQNHRVRGIRTFVENNDMSNDQIYKMLILGQEKLSPDLDLKWDISFYATVIPWNNNIVAYTTPYSNTITYNAAFLHQDDAQHSRTICHEYLHLVGFYHDSYPSGAYNFTPAYAIGDICQYLYISFFPSQDEVSVDNGIECGFWCWLKGIFR